MKKISKKCCKEVLLKAGESIAALKEEFSCNAVGFAARHTSYAVEGTLRDWYEDAVNALQGKAKDTYLGTWAFVAVEHDGWYCGSVDAETARQRRLLWLAFLVTIIDALEKEFGIKRPQIT